MLSQPNFGMGHVQGPQKPNGRPPNRSPYGQPSGQSQPMHGGQQQYQPSGHGQQGQAYGGQQSAQPTFSQMPVGAMGQMYQRSQQPVMQPILQPWQQQITRPAQADYTSLVQLLTDMGMNLPPWLQELGPASGNLPRGNSLFTPRGNSGVQSVMRNY